MALLLVRFNHENKSTWGKLLGTCPHSPEDQVDIQPLATSAAVTSEVIDEFSSNANLVESGEPITVDAKDLLSPVTTDATILCQGLNYASHASESGHQTRKANLFFAKASSSICGPYDNIVRPKGVELLDYEVEIGVVLRKAVELGTVVTDENVGDYVGGFVLANDVSARDTMFGAGYFQWFQGKSFRTFCPLGPVLYLLEPGEVSKILGSLALSLEYEGETKQASNSSLQLYKAPETLTQAADFMDLKPGDLLLTGTPGGVLAHGTPEVLAILKDYLVDDSGRREQLVEEFKSHHPFLQPGDTLKLTLKDEVNGLELGSQLSKII